MCKRHFVVGGHYMYLNCWFIFQGSLFLLVAGKNFKDDYIVFHDAYGTNTPAYIRDAQVPLVSLVNPDNYAILTCPRESLFIAESTLPNAGLGVFAARRIPEGTYFGPYTGYKSNTMLDGGTYAWTVFSDSGDFMYYVDAFDARISNWLRFVNCPNTAYQQNLISIYYDGDIFYQAIRDIQVGEELLIYYGYHYAAYLGINTTQLFEYSQIVSKLIIT